jgi:hypothetical protein
MRKLYTDLVDVVATQMRSFGVIGRLSVLQRSEFLTTRVPPCTLPQAASN